MLPTAIGETVKGTPLCLFYDSPQSLERLKEVTSKGAGDRCLQLHEWGLCPGPWQSPEVQDHIGERTEGANPWVPGFPAPERRPSFVSGTETEGCWISRVFSRVDNEDINAYSKALKSQGPALFSKHHIILSDSYVTRRRGPGLQF